MKNEKLTLNAFMAARPDVLSAWPTGADVDLEAAAAFHQTLPQEKNVGHVIWKAHQDGRVLLQPRAGVALVDEHIRLLQYLAKKGQADLLPTTIDAYTRQNRYNDAEAGINRSLQAGASLLNGFPAVNHGLAACRQVVTCVEKPVQIRHGTPDARLLAEITLAGGFTSFEGGGISYNIPYAKKVPLARSIADWQYVDRLAGWYAEQGVIINREPFGPLTGTLIPPCLSHAVAIIEGLLALAQGVKSITLGYGQAGNLIQDMAALKALRELGHHYFIDQGFEDYTLTTVFHQWMGGFPLNESKAFAVIGWGAAAGALGGADKLIVKTPHEAMGVPTKKANAQGLLATRQMVNMLQDQGLGELPQLEAETDLIKAEVACLLEKVFDLGQGSLAKGAEAAFKAGVLDIPFSPSLFNRGKVLPIRDNEGFVRISQSSHLPLSRDILDYHQERIEDRARAEGRPISFHMVTDDIYAISKGFLVGRPR